MITAIKKIKEKIFLKVRNIFTLESGGERVDIKYSNINNFEKFNIYQKSHYKRYEFALKNISAGDVVGDMACGTGYGSVFMSNKASEVISIDIDQKVIDKIKKRYSKIKNVKFICADLINLDYKDYFDKIISFETIEHLEEKDILKVLSNFNKALKNNGTLIFSTPYMQEKNEQTIKMGFHKTFYINEDKIKKWLDNTGFEYGPVFYQNYTEHEVKKDVEINKDFIVVIANKK